MIYSKYKSGISQYTMHLNIGIFESHYMMSTKTIPLIKYCRYRNNLYIHPNVHRFISIKLCTLVPQHHRFTCWKLANHILICIFINLHIAENMHAIQCMLYVFVKSFHLLCHLHPSPLFNVTYKCLQSNTLI